jgi:ABC-type Fe3+/spermidine/putrescine transport system ATPase subunit
MRSDQVDLPSIRVTNLSKRFGRVIALDKVGFLVKNREYIGILGPSGCGKTTLIKCIAGILQPEKGHVYIGDKLVDGAPPEDRGIGYVFQNIALFPHMNVRDNIGYGLRVKQVDFEESRRLVSETIALIRYNADPGEFPRELSGGMQQKVAVARALASRTELLLLDEPLSALDAKVRVELRYELRKLVKDLKLTAIHITHDQEEVMSIADRIIIMKKGQIVEIGTPAQLYFRPKNLFTANFLGEANFIEGEVQDIQKYTMTIKIKEGIILEAPLKAEGQEETAGEGTENNFPREKKSSATEFFTNQLVVTAIRPEFISFSKRGSASSVRRRNTIRGKIGERIFSGGTYVYGLVLENDLHLSCRVPFDESREMPKQGEEINVTLDPQAMLVFPYPRIGLAKEISLE